MDVNTQELVIFIVVILVGSLVFWLIPIIWEKLPRLTLPTSPRLEKKIVKITFRLKNIFWFPLRLLWNLLVTLLIIKAFILWYGFIFGSVVGVILIYIFVPHLFGLPLLLLPWYTKMWDKETEQ
jgi:hypothetical protein